MDVIFRQSVQRKSLSVSLFLGVEWRAVGIERPIETAIFIVVEVFAEIIKSAVSHLAILIIAKSIGSLGKSPEDAAVEYQTLGRVGHDIVVAIEFAVESAIGIIHHILDPKPHNVGMCGSKLLN